MKRVLLVRHGDEPADDRVVSWLTSAGYKVDSRKPFAGDFLVNPKRIWLELSSTVVFTTFTRLTSIRF